MLRVFITISAVVFSSFLFGQTPQPDYQMPYGKIKAEDVKLTLDRILNYLDRVTPAVIVNSKTTQPLTDMGKPVRDAGLAKGDFKITSHEWGLVYSGMLMVADATGDQKFMNYVASRLKFLSEAVRYFRAYANEFPQENNPLRNVLEPQLLDEAG